MNAVTRCPIDELQALVDDNLTADRSDQVIRHLDACAECRQRVGCLAGTPHYMSPEQARGASLDARSDLFSLGSVMFTMLAGRPPVHQELGSETIERIASHRVPSLRETDAEVPEWLQRLVDLLWNAAASKPPSDIKPSPPSPRPVTASRTRHFYVMGDPFGSQVPASLLEEIAKDAETIYRNHTRECFDQDPIAFAELCGIDVTLNPNGGNRSQTSYIFTSDGRVDDAMMHVEGRPGDLQGKLRHEIMHLVLAAQFKTPLPRWIGEGFALHHEAGEVVERMKDQITRARATNELMSLKQLFGLKSYPSDPKRVTLMYAQALSVVDWLIERGGKKKLLQCMQSVEPTTMAKQLPEAIVKAYGFDDLPDMENQWRESL